MKLKEFAELMGVSLAEAEKMLEAEDVISIDLNKEKVNKEKEKLEIIKV